MSQSSDRKEPIVEPAPSDDYSGTLTSRALGQRIRQQELLAELGVLALQGTSFMDMLNHAARITAEGLEAEYCKVLVIREKREAALPAVSPRTNRMFGSGSCALGFFNRETASDSVEHGHLSLLDRCDCIVDGERRLFVQQLGIIRSAFNSQIVLSLGYFRL